MPNARRFKPVTSVGYARFLARQPGFIHRKRSKGRFAVGVRYELQVHEYLELLVLGRKGIQYRKHVWIEFTDQEDQKRWCELDGLLIDRNQKCALIYEIKYQHTADAWWQLTHLYEPVIRKLLPDFHVSRMEIVHWHDPAVAFPERYDLTESALRVPKANKVAVFIWNPKRSGNRRQNGVAPAGHNGSEGNGQAAGGLGYKEGSDGRSGLTGSHCGRVVQPGSSEVPPGAEGEAITTRSSD